MSEPKICPGCPTGGRMKGVGPIMNPATGGSLKRNARDEYHGTGIGLSYVKKS